MSKFKVILIHIFFWVVLLLGVVLMSFGTPYLISSPFSVFVLGLHVLIPFFFYVSYFNAFSILQRKRNIKIAVAILVTAFCLLLIITQQLAAALYLLGIPLFWIMLGGISGYFFDWFKKDKKQVELENKNIESELALLKSHINPHFLFNTLHNIDALITADSEKASDTLIRLSQLMRYMTYDSNDKQVELSKEIDYLKNYIALQTLCLINKNMVSFHFQGTPDAIYVAPMLFIPFIENAFKHVSQKETEDNIRINFVILERKIVFKISNKYNIENVSGKEKYSGVGLETVKRRLELLYPQKHVLNIYTDNGRFNVNLSIDI